MGRHFKGGQRHLIFWGSAPHPEEVQVHLLLVHIHDYSDDRPGWRWARWPNGAIYLADQLLYRYLAAGYCCYEPFPAAHCFESRFDAFYLVDTKFLRSI
jgi:hypothetical protein